MPRFRISLVALVVIACKAICIVAEANRKTIMPYMSWMEWPSLKSHKPQPMDENKVYEAIQALNTFTDPFINQNLHRVDRYIINSYGEEFMFAWTKTVCHSVNHSVWRESNGHEFAAILGANLHRMRHAHIFRDDHSVAIDIGAHVGDSTIPIAFLAKRTIAFEPSNHSFSFLKANIALNPHLNISAHQLAVGQTDGEVIVNYVNGDNSVDVECNAIIKSGASSSGNSGADVKIPMVNLENFLFKEYGKAVVSKIGFIKIDAFGYDSVILGSIANLIKQVDRFPVIQVDYGFPKSIATIDAGAKALFQAIAALPGNYNPFCIAKCEDVATAYFSKCPFKLRQLHIIFREDAATATRVVEGIKFKSNTDSSGNICDDLLLYPADYSHMPLAV